MVMGFLSILFIHVWENAGMTLGLMPVTGIPLPFISYGGTFQLVNLAMIGLCLSVRYNRSGKRTEAAKIDFLDDLKDKLAAYGERQIQKERLRRERRKK